MSRQDAAVRRAVSQGESRSLMDPLRLELRVGWKASKYEFRVGWLSRLRVLLTGRIVVEETNR